jgi:hypothetical protein
MGANGAPLSIGALDGGDAGCTGFIGAPGERGMVSG